MRRPVKELIAQFFTKSASRKTVAITATGVLTVIVTPDKADWYTNDNASASIGWSPMSGNSCTLVINWGDGTIETKTVIYPGSHVHKYTAQGPYTITATVTDSATKATGSGSASVTVKDSPISTLTASPTSGNVPLTVAFTFSMSGGYPPYTWTLDPGDGSAPYSNPTSPKNHTYTAVGAYSAFLDVSDSKGATVTALVPIGAGIRILFPKLRELFPRIFERFDKARGRVREKMPTIPAP